MEKPIDESHVPDMAAEKAHNSGKGRHGSRMVSLPRSSVSVRMVWTGVLLAGLLIGGTVPEAGLVSDHRKGVVGGVHDFSGRPGEAGGGCQACHIAHLQGLRMTTQPVGTPATQPATQPAVEVYRLAGQRQVFVPDRYMPGPTSLICLSCHDGTIATSTIGSSHAMLAGVREGFKMPGGFVGRDHPIGVPYSLKRGEFHPLAFVQGKGIRLPDGRVECVSCHDPHNQHGFSGLLVVSNRRSALCLTCHIK